MHSDIKSKHEVRASFELTTFCVLGRCDNHYTTGPVRYLRAQINLYIIKVDNLTLTCTVLHR